MPLPRQMNSSLRRIETSEAGEITGNEDQSLSSPRYGGRGRARGRGRYNYSYVSSRGLRHERRDSIDASSSVGSYDDSHRGRGWVGGRRGGRGGRYNSEGRGYSNYRRSSFSNSFSRNEDRSRRSPDHDSRYSDDRKRDGSFRGGVKRERPSSIGSDGEIFEGDSSGAGPPQRSQLSFRRRLEDQTPEVRSATRESIEKRFTPAKAVQQSTAARQPSPSLSSPSVPKPSTESSIVNEATRINEQVLQAPRSQGLQPNRTPWQKRNLSSTPMAKRFIPAPGIASTALKEAESILKVEPPHETKVVPRSSATASPALNPSLATSTVGRSPGGVVQMNRTSAPRWQPPPDVATKSVAAASSASPLAPQTLVTTPNTVVVSVPPSSAPPVSSQNNILGSAPPDSHKYQHQSSMNQRPQSPKQTQPVCVKMEDLSPLQPPTPTVPPVQVKVEEPPSVHHHQPSVSKTQPVLVKTEELVTGEEKPHPQSLPSTSFSRGSDQDLLNNSFVSLLGSRFQAGPGGAAADAGNTNDDTGEQRAGGKMPPFHHGSAGRGGRGDVVDAFGRSKRVASIDGQNRPHTGSWEQRDGRGFGGRGRSIDGRGRGAPDMKTGRGRGIFHPARGGTRGGPMIVGDRGRGRGPDSGRGRSYLHDTRSASGGRGRGQVFNSGLRLSHDSGRGPLHDPGRGQGPLHGRGRGHEPAIDGGRNHGVASESRRGHGGHEVGGWGRGGRFHDARGRGRGPPSDSGQGWGTGRGRDGRGFGRFGGGRGRAEFHQQRDSAGRGSGFDQESGSHGPSWQQEQQQLQQQPDISSRFSPAIHVQQLQHSDRDPQLKPPPTTQPSGTTPPSKFNLKPPPSVVSEQQLQLERQRELAKQVEEERRDRRESLLKQPEPKEPTGYVQAVLRLLDLEAQMEYLHAKLVQQQFKSRILGEQRKVLNDLPVGLDAFIEELQEATSRANIQNTGKEKTGALA